VKESLETGLTKTRLKPFTLLELICVMAISALLIGLVIGRVGKVPAYLTFKNNLYHISDLMDEASNYAELNGKKLVILYDDGHFYPQDESIRRRGSNLDYQLPSFIDVSFNDNAPQNKQFVFFPDGSSSGPAMTFSFKGHIALLKLSKLTGMPILKIDE